MPLQDVRAAIDEIDREVLRLLGLRAHYVNAAARFRTGKLSVQGSGRKAQVLAARCAWATEEGLDADFVEHLYRHEVEHFTCRELCRVMASREALSRHAS